MLAIYKDLINTGVKIFFMLLLVIPLLLISSVFTSFPYQPLAYEPQEYPPTERIEYHNSRHAYGYQQTIPHSAPVAINHLSSALAPYYSQHVQIQLVPINCPAAILVPITQFVMSAPVCIYFAQPAPRMLLSRPREQRLSFSVPAADSNENSHIYSIEEFMYRAIYDSISFNCNFDKIYRTDINLKTFIFGLQGSKASLSIAGETHLNWFVEFACSLFHTYYQDNLVDYFDYIKEFHLKNEIDHNPNIGACIDTAIARLIQGRCILPEIISQLVEMVGKGMNPQRADYHYGTFKNSILVNEYNLSKNELARYLIVLESFLEFIPHLPLHIVLLNKNEYHFGHLRLSLHFANIYEILIGFRQCDPSEVSSAIYRMYHYYDGTIINIFAFEKFQVLDRIIKRVFLRILHSDSKETDTIFVRFDSVANEFVKSFIPDNLTTFIKGQLNNLLDFYFYFTSLNKKIDMGFVDYVAMSFYSVPTNRYVSMYQIAIYLSYYEMTLSQFREKFKSKILDLQIDEDFVLVLETIISATEEIDLETAYYETWEPSIEFLLLQSQIISSKNDDQDRHQIVDSPYPSHIIY